VAITEQRSRADIDLLADVLGRAVAAERSGAPVPRREGEARMMPTETAMQRDRAVTIFEKGQAGRRAFSPPPLDVPQRSLDELIPSRLRRREPAAWPEVSEPELVRHYVRISRRNFDLDTGFYPLGSCTMKHNPRLHERSPDSPVTRGCTRCRIPNERRARSS